jgi:hypothetical protein
LDLGYQARSGIVSKSIPGHVACKMPRRRGSNQLQSWGAPITHEAPCTAQIQLLGSSGLCSQLGSGKFGGQLARLPHPQVSSASLSLASTSHYQTADQILPLRSFLPHTSISGLLPVSCAGRVSRIPFTVSRPRLRASALAC